MLVRFVARLTEREAVRLDAALSQLYTLVPFAHYPARALAASRQLIGCIHCSYNEIDFTNSSHRVLVDQPELALDVAVEPFRRYLPQHPVIAHYARGDDPRSHLISDFVTPREFRQLELYGEFFRLLETETQLSNTLPTSGGRYVIGLAFNRGRRGFSERDRLLLDLLRPHLIVSHQNATALTASLTGAHSDRARESEALGRLTDRQLEILRLVSEGQSNKQIAYRLGISAATAKKHLEHIHQRLDVTTRTAAAACYLTATAPAPPDWTPTIEVR